MADRDLTRLKFVVKHSNLLTPEDYLRFIHLDGFTNDWNDLKLDDIDLSILQIQIMLGPLNHPVIQGTGGLRKMRFRPQSWGRGKSGAVRVLYALFPDHSISVLAAAYGKAAKENIDAAEKRTLKKILREIALILDGKNT